MFKGPLIHSDPFNKIGPELTLAVSGALFVVIVGCLFCIGYCCCFNCHEY